MLEKNLLKKIWIKQNYADYNFNEWYLLMATIAIFWCCLWKKIKHCNQWVCSKQNDHITFFLIADMAYEGSLHTYMHHTHTHTHTHTCIHT
jgi:hypothetical protein